MEYNTRKNTVEDNFNCLVHFHSQFLRSFDDLLHKYQRQHYGKYEEISVNKDEQNLRKDEYSSTIMKAEDLLKQIENRYKTNIQLEEIMGDMFVELDQMKQRLHALLLECGKDNMYLMNKNEEIIDVIEHCQHCFTNGHQQSQLSTAEGLEKYRNVFDKVIQNICIPNLLHEYFVQEQVDQLKEWTGFTFKTILFDSKFITLTSKNIFSKMIIGKNHLLFLIEDENHNKFGGYVDTTIGLHDTWINDPNAFIFSLFSNERLTEMERFSLSDPDHAFYLSSSTDDDVLFTFGQQNDITVNIQSRNQPSISNFTLGPFGFILTGKKTFIPQRLLVIEMKPIVN